jgi:hypothetical protein
MARDARIHFYQGRRAETLRETRERGAIPSHAIQLYGEVLESFRQPFFIAQTIRVIAHIGDYVFITVRGKVDPRPGKNFCIEGRCSRSNSATRKHLPRFIDEAQLTATSEQSIAPHNKRTPIRFAMKPL